MRVNVFYQQIPTSLAFNHFVKESVKQHQHMLGNEGHMEWVISETADSKCTKVHYKSGHVNIHVEGRDKGFYQAASKAMDHLLRAVKKKKAGEKSHIHNRVRGNYLIQ